jgi:hypothetical protein
MDVVVMVTVTAIAGAVVAVVVVAVVTAGEMEMAVEVNATKAVADRIVVEREALSTTLRIHQRAPKKVPKKVSLSGQNLSRKDVSLITRLIQSTIDCLTMSK